MSVSPRGFFTSSVSFSPLFRLLDDFENYSRQVGGGLQHVRRSTGLSTWHPKFDIHETTDNYELHGEFPGLNKENAHIYFTDPHTMVVSGKVERTYSAGTPPTGLTWDNAVRRAITQSENTQHPSADAPFQERVSDNDKSKFWLTERSIGEFSRSFNFPNPVDRDAVSACLKNGVLSVTVPKLGKQEYRRITIS